MTYLTLTVIGMGLYAAKLIWDIHRTTRKLIEARMMKRP